MLEIICAGSLALSIHVCPSTKSIDLAVTEKLEISDLIQEKIMLNEEYLAKGRDYKSDYRREADRQRERHEIRNRDHRDRDHRDRNYRDRVNRDRNYRDAERRRREDEDVEERRERYYRPERYNRYYRREISR